MALKRRGRKPGKKTLETRSELKLKTHWLDCASCGLHGAEVDGDVTRFTCGTCVQKVVAAPALKAPPTDEQKIAKKARKEAREARRVAIAAGGVVEPPKFKFGRGWHRKIVFSAEVAGKTLYFSLGKEVKKAEFTKFKKAQKSKVKNVKKPNKFGRGWHLKAKFVAPNGDVYKKGVLVK